MLITDIYQRYKILPFLQEHQLRVAAVAKRICDAGKEPIDTAGAISAALLHDMGNILKSDFDVFPETTEPEGVAYWQDVQKQFKGRYGADAQRATYAIAEELGVPRQIQAYIKATGFGQVLETLRGSNLEKKIVCYADQRVAPYGVVSLADRIAEGQKRWANKATKMVNDEYMEVVAGLKGLEAEIFATLSITPEDISDRTIRPLIGQLRKFDVQARASGR